MNTEDVLNTLRQLKPVLKKEGITLLGVFGSYARGDYTAQSDVDILYDIDDPKKFAQKFGGFAAFSHLEKLRDMIADTLNRKVDFVARRGLNSVGEKYILKDMLYV